MFKFKFHGGVDQGSNETSKFLCFIFNVESKKEEILFVAEKNGLVTKVDSTNYSISTPYIKIFNMVINHQTNRKLFHSFFIKLDNRGDELTIYPFAEFARKSDNFCGKGRLMTFKEVGNLLGIESESFNIFSKQRTLSKKQIKEILLVNENIQTSRKCKRKLLI